GRATLRIEDREHGRAFDQDLSGSLNINLDRRMAILTSNPTYQYVLTFALDPGTVLELRDFKVVSDFQFASLPLVKLRPRDNEVRTHFPEGTDPAAFELVISTK